MDFRSMCVTSGSGPNRLVAGTTLDELAVADAIVGETVALAFATPIGVEAFSLKSLPPGSVAETIGSTFVPDVPGVYEIDARNEGVRRSIRVVAFPSAALLHRSVREPNGQMLPSGWTQDPAPRSEEAIRDILQSCARNLIERPELFAALTTDRPIPLGVDWSGR